MATPAAIKQALARAAKADNKSEGYRLMLDAGLTVTEIVEATGAPYGFVYGVARRHGAITPEPRAAKAAAPKAKAAAKPAAKAATKPAARSTAKPAAKPAAKKATTRK